MSRGEGEKAEGRHSLAEERTDWALDRTALAKERTFNAWLRTGLASVAAGVGVSRLLKIEDFPLLTKMLGAILIAAGAALFVIAFWRYRQGYQELLKADVRFLPLWLVAFLVLFLLVGAFLSFLLVFLP